MAFSGGVDSSLLLKVASESLGHDCIALTVDAPYHFRRELADASELASDLGVRHFVIPFDPDTVPGLMQNPEDRCYRCKKEMLRLCLKTVATGAFSLIDGSNMDDQNAHRPGLRALSELGVRSPLFEAGFSKADVRELSCILGLKQWDKPAQSCLLTRFPYNYSISQAELLRVERVESEIQKLGFRIVRVRSSGDMAKIECDKADEAQGLFEEIERICLEAGFSEIDIDPAGYRSGSMDRI